MAETLSAKEAAAALGTDARTLRKFLRSKAQDVIEPVGQGKRYALTKGDVKKLKKSFISWSEGSTRQKDETETLQDEGVEIEEIEVEDDPEEIEDDIDIEDDDEDDGEEDADTEDDEEDEPSDEDLMEIELEELD